MASEHEVIRRQTVLRSDRFALTGHSMTMKAVVTIGNGGLDMLEYRDVPVPRPGPGEVRLQVLAVGVNNTKINTRLGSYPSRVTASTESAAAMSTWWSQALRAASVRPLCNSRSGVASS